MPLELLAGAAVGAAAASPSIRKVLRQGMIYGLGGLLIAYDKVAVFAQEAAKGARNGLAAAAARDAGDQAKSTPATPPAEAAAPAAPAPAQTPAAAPSA
jgi:hypothetical protein